jgi:hypothetical protein
MFSRQYGPTLINARGDFPHHNRGRASDLCREGEKEAVLFLKKKNQKDFINLGHGRWIRPSPWPKAIKVFAPLFSKSGCFAQSRFVGLPSMMSEMMRC